MSVPWDTSCLDSFRRSEGIRADSYACLAPHVGVFRQQEADHRSLGGDGTAARALRPVAHRAWRRSDNRSSRNAPAAAPAPAHASARCRHPPAWRQGLHHDSCAASGARQPGARPNCASKSRPSTIAATACITTATSSAANALRPLRLAARMRRRRPRESRISASTPPKPKRKPLKMGQLARFPPIFAIHHSVCVHFETHRMQTPPRSDRFGAGAATIPVAGE